MAYCFKCAKCEANSEPLEKQYTKLRKGEKWICKKCKTEEMIVVMEFKKGFIIKEDEF